MLKDNVSIASGYIKGEAHHPEMRRGSRRIYDFKLPKKMGFFPINWAWESYVIFKAMQMGFSIKFDKKIDAEKVSVTTINKIKLYYYGKAIRALGDDFENVLGSAIIYKSLLMIKGGLASVVKSSLSILMYVK